MGLFEDKFHELMRTASDKAGVPTSEFRAGGRVSKENPNKENDEWWLKNGPLMVDRWVEWRDGSGWKFLDINGEPAIELGMNITLGGVGIKMFLDRVMVTPDGEIVIVDLKTGSRTPESDLQLAFYAVGLEQTYGIRPKWGTYWMARTGQTSGLVDLDHYSTDMITEIVTKFHSALTNNVFLPRFAHCKMCSVVDFCKYKTPNHKEY